MVNYQVGIMAVRNRAVHVYRLMYDLKNQGIEPTVIWDDSRSGAWRTAQRFWELVQSEYGVLLQDDVEVSPVFRENIEGIIEQGSIETVLSGFWPNKKVGEAFEQGYRYIHPTNVVWGQCVCANMDFINKFLEWEVRNVNPKSGCDDARITMYCVDHSLDTYIAVPSLVQHKELKSESGNPIAPFGRRRVLPKEYVATEVYNWERTETNCKPGLKKTAKEYDGMRV